MSPLRTLLVAAALGTLTGAARLGAAGNPPPPAGARLRLGTTKFRIPTAGRMLAFAPDGKSVIALRYPDALRFLSVETGREVKTVPLPAEAAQAGWSALARTADGKRLVATQYNAVYVLDAGTGAVVYKVALNTTDPRLGGLPGGAA